MSAILASAATVPVNKVKSDSTTVSTAEIMLTEFQTLAAQIKAISFGTEALLVTPSVRDQTSIEPAFPFSVGLRVCNAMWKQNAFSFLPS